MEDKTLLRTQYPWNANVHVGLRLRVCTGTGSWRLDSSAHGYEDGVR
jgi:hypothetical protein